ncbi:hypothetical protein KPZU09_70100 [Klebsiella pneumoniae]|uniref:Mannitol dehydrogenase N-terminal domain-containing protein n=1 Tax=Klebsiella pneumoniae TaxID=573 RepID=A0A919I3R3_KLEPN|nr:hypothetical protein KPZU09_70100 [Klebsiella pneumoniae]
MTTIATATLPKNVQYPQYDRSQLRSRIVHFGFGAFHRAHRALLTDRVLNNVGGDWGICEISLFSGDTLMSQLREQDHLFTVLEKGADGNQPIVIGAVHECLNARLDSLAAIIEKFCEPQVAIVSLTITEKGYCIDPATGKLDPTHPRIIHDLENPTLPQSAPGILVEALARRRERGLPPFTVLSCDNIPDNGHVVKMPSSAWRKNAARRWRTGSPTTSASRAPWWIALFPRPHRSRWRKSPPCWGRRSLRHQLRTLHSVGGRRSLCRRAPRTGDGGRADDR